MGGMIGGLVTDDAAYRDLKARLGLDVAPYPEFKGRPTRITDGDTFRLGKTRVRLLGVDAPEMSTAAGELAKLHLERLVAEAKGPLRCLDTGERTYERVVAKCYTARGEDISKAMAEAGWATAMVRFSGVTYVPAQAQAMWRRQGMWAPDRR
jgi:endonuclease YncB( thermonuclease family)